MLGGDPPDVDSLERMPYLDMVLDEVLRLYPPAWIGPRRAVREFEFGGYTVPRDAYVNYCSWASHRIPEVFPDPEAFIPERFTPERKAALPRGAYVPFGGGSRICIGKRFGQTEVKLVATMLLQRLRLDALPGRTMTVRQMPTLSPKGGLPMRRALPPALLDEQHLLVLGQRPEVVGDDLLQRVGRLAHPVHRRELLVARVDRQVEALELVRVGVRLLELEQRLAERVEPGLDLARDAFGAARLADQRHVAQRRRQDHRLGDRVVVSASMLARIAYCSTQTSKRDSSSRLESTL